jgi:hypothetical protein
MFVPARHICVHSLQTVHPTYYVILGHRLTQTIDIALRLFRDALHIVITVL